MHRAGEFKPDERFDAVAVGEAAETALAILADALDQVRGDAGVERAVTRAGRDSGAGLEVGVRGVEARAAMDPGSRRTSHGSRASSEERAGLDASLRIVMPDLIWHPCGVAGRKNIDLHLPLKFSHPFNLDIR